MNRPSTLGRSAVLSLLFVPTVVFAQTAGTKAATPAFDVASIRQNKAGEAQHAGPTPNGYRMTNMSMLLPILAAYAPTQGGETSYYTNDRILGAPDWVRSERYDIDAKVGPNDLAEWQKPASQRAMLPPMLQALLAERCKLAVHREMKEIAVYTLVVGKNGPKLKDAKPAEPHPGAVTLPGGTMLVPSNGGQTLNFYNASMQSLAQVLSNFTGRPVQDKTGLTGRYDFTFEKGQSPEEQARAAEAGTPTVSIFTTVQEQLGLRLDSAKGSVETLVIDHLERPSEN